MGTELVVTRACGFFLSGPPRRLDDVEKEYLQWVLDQSESLAEAAERIGMDIKTLRLRRHQYGLVWQDRRRRARES